MPAAISLYGHMLDGNQVEFGRRIWQGDTVGAVGSTGGRSTGNHLHYSVISEEAGKTITGAGRDGSIGIPLNDQNTRVDPAGYDNYDPTRRYLDETKRVARIMSGNDASTTSGGRSSDRQRFVRRPFRKMGFGPSWRGPNCCIRSSEICSTTASEIGPQSRLALSAIPVLRSCARWRSTGDRGSDFRRVPHRLRRRERFPPHPRFSPILPARVACFASSWGNAWSPLWWQRRHLCRRCQGPPRQILQARNLFSIVHRKMPRTGRGLRRIRGCGRPALLFPASSRVILSSP